ncbi:MAG: PqqD family protein [Acidimicrobiia bacterium]|nr:PqqD family protein [Acidimicrobiia bacterium]
MSLLRRSPLVLSRSLLDGVLILPSGADDPLALNESAAEVWRRWNGSRRPAEVASEIAEVYGHDADIGADVESVARMLVDHGALEVVAVPPP